MRKSNSSPPATNKPPEDPPSAETKAWLANINENMKRMSTDETFRKKVAMQSTPPHLVKTNEWLDKSMENMKRMSTDETYRKKIAKDLS